MWLCFASELPLAFNLNESTIKIVQYLIIYYVYTDTKVQSFPSILVLKHSAHFTDKSYPNPSKREITELVYKDLTCFIESTIASSLLLEKQLAYFKIFTQCMVTLNKPNQKLQI